MGFNSGFKGLNERRVCVKLLLPYAVINLYMPCILTFLGWEFSSLQCFCFHISIQYRVMWTYFRATSGI